MNNSNTRQNIISKNTYEVYPKNNLVYSVPIKTQQWYDVFPFSLALWPSYYSEMIRKKNWWHERHNYHLLAIEYILDGEMMFIQNGLKSVVKRNELYISHPGNDIRRENFGPNDVREHQLIISGSMLKLLLNNLDMENIFHLELPEDNNILKQIKNIVKLITEKRAGTEAETSKAAYSILADLCMLGKNPDFIMLPPELTKAIMNMQNELEHNFSIDELAEMTQASKPTLHRLFKKYLKTTPLSFLIELKMENAKNLISNSSLSFKEIAAKLGYKNSLYFSLAFKKYTGVAPSKYRMALK